MDPLIFGIITVELMIIAWIDIKTKRISNIWSLANLMMFFFFLVLLPQAYPLHISHFFYPLGFLVIGFILFNLKIMGAGDSKLLSSLFLITPYKFHHLLFENILYATMITGTIFFMIAVVKNWKDFKAFTLSTYWRGVAQIIKSKFSYAPVIAIAWMLLGVKR